MNVLGWIAVLVVVGAIASVLWFIMRRARRRRDRRRDPWRGYGR